MAKKFDRSQLPPSPDLRYETALWSAGTRIVAGIDEAGRGAMAGPVAAAALVLPIQADLCRVMHGVRDSKEMTPRERQYWAGQLRNLAVEFGVGFGTHQEIDELGIVAATHLAIQRALSLLSCAPQHLLIDYLEMPEVPVPQTSLVKGDARSLSIASASVMAKTARDELMIQMDLQYPGYGFGQHKGYGTALHRQALARLGLSPIHRRSFKFKEESE